MTATIENPTHNTDQAQAGTTPAAAPELLLIDPTTLMLDGNVRGTVTLDKDFVESIREHGVLIPIVAVRTAEGFHRVRYGQRRTLAAIEVGHATVPVVVVGTEQSDNAAIIDRIVTQVHENQLRAGLSTADQTAAVEQLAAFGLTAGQIVKKAKVSRADVDHALAIAGSTLARRSVDRWTFMTLAEAAAVAEFDGDPETVKKLVAAAKTGEGTFAHVAQRARDDREADQARAAVAAKLAESGVRVITGGEANTPTAKTVGELVTGAGKPLDADKHAACPGHAAFISDGGYYGGTRTPKAVFVCTDWKANGHRDRYQADRIPAAQMSTAEREKASAERRTVIENNKAWISAETVRRSWLAAFLTRKTAPKGAAVFVAVELTNGAHELNQALDYSGNAVLHKLVGVKDKTAMVAAAQGASDARAQVLALAFVLAAYEAQTDKMTWRNPSAQVGRYFAFLAAQGYELSPVEVLCLPKTAKPTRKPTAAAAPVAPVADAPASVEQDEVAA